MLLSEKPPFILAGIIAVILWAGAYLLNLATQIPTLLISKQCDSEAIGQFLCNFVISSVSRHQYLRMSFELITGDRRTAIINASDPSSVRVYVRSNIAVSAWQPVYGGIDHPSGREAIVLERISVPQNAQLLIDFRVRSTIPIPQDDIILRFRDAVLGADIESSNIRILRSNDFFERLFAYAIRNEFYIVIFVFLLAIFCLFLFIFSLYRYHRSKSAVAAP